MEPKYDAVYPKKVYKRLMWKQFTFHNISTYFVRCFYLHRCMVSLEASVPSLYQKIHGISISDNVVVLLGWLSCKKSATLISRFVSANILIDENEADGLVC